MSQSNKGQSVSEIFIGRQPIFDRELNVVAYELLYRNGEANNAANIIDGEIATMQVVNTAFMEIGFDDLVGEGKAYLNMPRGFVLSESALSLPKERVVLELLEEVEIDSDIIAAMQKLSEQGFTIALDDFIYHDKIEPMVELADIIKIDLMALSVNELDEYVSRLQTRDVRLLAEKVETQEEFEKCKTLGFELFQGYFFSRPQIIKGEKLPGNRLAVLHLVSKIQNPDASFLELEELISQDVTLGYKLLRVINSAAYSLPHKIDSLKQALSILEPGKVRNWSSMIAFSSIDDKPSELFNISIIRAKMCELLAKEMDQKDADSYFTVGLFSNLDALMDQPLEDLVEALPLAVDVKQAVLSQAGSMGEVLHCVLAYESGQWNEVCVNKLHPSQIRKAYTESLHWAREISKEIGAGV